MSFSLTYPKDIKPDLSAKKGASSLIVQRRLCQRCTEIELRTSLFEVSIEYSAIGYLRFGCQGFCFQRRLAIQKPHVFGLDELKPKGSGRPNPDT